MVKAQYRWSVVLLAMAGAATAGAWGAELTPTTMPAEPALPVRAELRADRSVYQAGRPLWVDFLLTNLSDRPVTLRIPDTPTDEEPGGLEIGLPLGHVFSGVRHSGVIIKDERGDLFDGNVSVRPRGPAAAVRLAPHATIGLGVELTQYYPALRRPGRYTLTWRPYNSSIESLPLTLNLLAERQAIILTEFGTMTIQFYYDQAPYTVENFIELVEQRFYDNLTFHKVVPHGIIQGGDPRGDGKGVRHDGKRIKAEFSNIPFEIGTVGMARLPRDPDSASSQFFICAGRQPSFDGQQTAFGYLVGEESFQTLQKIAAVPTDGRDRPRKPVTIRAISLASVPGRELELLSSERPDRPQTTQPAIMPNGKRDLGGLSRLDGSVPTTRPAAPGSGS